MDVLDMLDVLDGAKATGVGRVRTFAIFSSLFCLQTTARDSCVTRRPTRTHPCSRIRTVDYFSFAQQRRQAEEYASLRFPLAPLAGTDRLLLFATTETIAPRYHEYRDLFRGDPSLLKNWDDGHSFLAQQHRQAEEYASLRHPFALFAGTDQPAALRAKGRLACPSTRRRCRARGTLVGGQGLGLEGIWYRIR